jgi:hypothetical protein
MKYLLCLAVLAVTAACAKDVTAAPAPDACLQAKRDFLTQHFGASYSPTPELLAQNQFNLGGTSKAVFTVVGGSCQVTVSG